MDLNEYANAKDMSSTDIAAILKPTYHGIDRPFISKLRNPARYGARLVRRAEQILQVACPEKPYKPRRADGHRLGYKLSHRVTPEKYEGVHGAIKRRGYETIQDAYDVLTDVFLKNPEILPEKVNR